MNRFTDIKGLRPYLWPRKVYSGQMAAAIEPPPDQIRRDISPPQIGDYIYIGRGFQGRAVTITTTPTLIQISQFTWPYLILNPSASIGLTSYGTIYTGNIAAAGNSQATPIGVANYLNAHYFLNVTAAAGGASYDFIQQAYDPVTGAWFDVQTVFAAVAAVGNYYANVATLGTAINMAFRWAVVAAGTLTCTLSYVLKDGVGGTSSGLVQTVYLGSSNAVNTTSGFPILEGERYTFLLEEGVELWGVAAADVTIRVFSL